MSNDEILDKTYPLQETPDQWLKDFASRLAEALSKSISKDALDRPYMYEIDQEVSFKDLSDAQIEALTYSDYHGAFDTLTENNDDLHESDRANVESSLRSLLGEPEFKDEFAALSEAIEIDEDELIEKWLDDDDFSVSSLDAYVHSYDVRWHDRKAAYAELCDISFNCNPSSGNTMEFKTFDALRLLRVPIQEFILNVKSLMDDQLVIEDVLSQSNIEMLGLESVDLEDEDNADLTWGQIYEREVLNSYEIYKSHTGLSLQEYEDAACIDIEDLVKMMNAQSSEFALHVHVTLDSSTIDEVGIPSSTHDFNDDEAQRIVIKTGYFSTDASTGEGGPYAAQISSWICISPSQLRLLKDTPEHDSDDMELPGHQRLYSKLYEELVINPRGEKIDENSPEAKTIQIHCERLINKAPWWARQMVAVQRPIFVPESVMSNMNREPTQKELRQAVFRLRDLILEYRLPKENKSQPSKDLPLDEINLLIQGIPTQAIAEVDEQQLTSTFELACIQGLPRESIDMLPVKVTCNDDLVESSMTQIVRKIMRCSANPTLYKTRLSDALELLTKHGGDIPAAHAHGGYSTNLLLGSSDMLSKHESNPTLFEFVLDRFTKNLNELQFSKLLHNCSSKAVENGLALLVEPLIAKGLSPYDFIQLTEERRQRVALFGDYSRSIEMPRLEKLEAVVRSLMARDAAKDALSGLDLAIRI